MKKLLLTSAGFRNDKIASAFLALAGRPASRMSVALVPTAARSVSERYYVDASIKELEQLGFDRVEEIDAADALPPTALDGFDCLYMCGGNAFFIMKTIRETGFDQLIKDFIQRGGIYIGVSAGSIMLGPEISGAGYGKEGDPNDVGLTDTKGLGIVPFAVYPHVHPGTVGDAKTFMELVDYPVIPLTDEQAVLVQDEQFVRIGG